MSAVEVFCACQSTSTGPCACGHDEHGATGCEAVISSVTCMHKARDQFGFCTECSADVLDGGR